MKKVMGGVGEAGCSDWRTKEFIICYGCCLTVNSSETCLLESNCGDTPIHTVS